MEHCVGLDVSLVICSTSGFADRGSLALDGVAPLAHHSRRATHGPVAGRGAFWQFAARAYALPDIRLLPQEFSNAAGGIAVSGASSRSFEARLRRFSGSRLARSLSFADEDEDAGSTSSAAVVGGSSVTTIFSVVSRPIRMPIPEQASISISVVSRTVRIQGSIRMLSICM